jgi:hypothetical protein
MKVIEIARVHPTLDEVIGLAEQEVVVLRRADGAMFALAPIDDFELEVEQLKHNTDFMTYLRQLSEEKATISLEELRKELAS